MPGKILIPDFVGHLALITLIDKQKLLIKLSEFVFNIDEVRIPYNEHTLKYPKRSQAESSQYSNGKKKDYIWEPNPLGAKPKDVFEIPTIANGSWKNIFT